MSEKKGQNFLHGAAIYTAGIIIIKLLGAVYKIPLGNILGDEGFNHFDVTYKIYNVFLTIATAGVPVALSRLISEANAIGREQQVRRVFRVGLATFLVLGLVGTLAMLFFPEALAASVGDIHASICIFVMAPSVVLVCVAAAYRGYAQGHSDMIPTTVSQIVETAVKVAVGLAAAGILHRMGKSVEICAAGAILGTTVSSLAAMLYMQIKIHRKYTVNPPVTADSDVPDPGRRILGELLKIGIPITISSSIMSFVQLADSMITLNRLQTAAGYIAAEAYVLNGVYAKAMTVYNVPAAFVVPFMASVVPAISASRVRGNRLEVCDTAERALRMCTLLCLPMAVGMAVLARPCMEVLYPSSASQGGMLLTELGIVCYFMTMSLMTNAILPANGNERLPLVSSLLGLAAKIAATWFFVGNPRLNIYGAPLGTLCCYLVMLTTNLLFMARHMARPMNLWRILGRPGLSAALMGAAAWGVYRVLYGTAGLPNLVAFGAAVCAGVVVYVVAVIAFRAITLEDMKLFPRGERLAKLLHIR